MAKKITQQIELDIMAKGLNTLKQNFAEMATNTGNLGKEATSIIKYAERIEKIISQYGDSIPIVEAKQMQILFEKIANSSKTIGKMDKFDLVDEASLKKLEKAKEEYASIQSQIKNIQQEISKQTRKNSAQSIVATRAKELQQQKQANLNNKPVSLEPIKGKWKTKGDLENLSSSVDPKVAQAAAAALEQLSKAEEKQNAYVAKLSASQKELSDKLKALESSIQQIAPQIRELSIEEQTAAESAELFGDAQSRSLGMVTKATQEAGESTIKFTSSLEKQKNGIGLAVKSLFSFAAAWGLVKRLGREAVQTITEMDKSLTGMAMVTGKTKDEVNALVPQIQQLSQETSTAMTEVAELVTEYTKQGRNLQDSFTLAEETAKAAKIAGISAAEAVEYMTSAINGFNLAATDATKVSDIFANVAAVSATDFEDLAVGLSKVSAQANLAGMSIEYTTALIAKGIETTQEAPESIGTALKTILARMRELSDYGSTLEDGASVNGVESALAAAGIELRDVNGEFRDMEDIFNELGPKWDSLNTMQQQAIAQAVAGTRQQSRFVAIMQDWERTQELAAEAQDSAGASAVQYAVYAQGMEAQLTKLKSSWQEFIQSIASSKFIVNAVKMINSGLEKVNDFLEKSPDLIKNAVILVGGFLVATQALEKVRHALGMQSTEEIRLQNMQIENQKYLAQKEKEKLENTNKQLDEEIKKLQKIEELEEIKEKDSKIGKVDKLIKEKEQELVNNDTQVAESDDPNVKAQLEEGGNQILAELIALEEQRNQLIGERQVLVDEAHNKELQLSQERSNNLVKIQEQENLITSAQQAQKELIENSNNPLMQRLELLKQQTIEEERHTAEKIKQLEVANAELATKEAAAKASGDLKTEQKLAKTRQKNTNKILKLKQKQQKLEKKSTKLEQQQNELLEKQKGFVSTMGTTLSTTISASLKNIFAKLGPIGNLLNGMVDSAAEWGVELLKSLANAILHKKVNEEITDDNKEQAGLETAKNVSKVVGLGLNATEKEQEENITDEDKEQTGQEVVQLALQGATIASKNKEKKATSDIGNEETKNTAKKGANTFLDIISAFKSGGIPGIIAGIALATVIVGGIAGLAVAGATGGLSAQSDSDTESDIGSMQNTNYNLKKKNSSLSSTTSEMEEIQNKSIKSAEDEEKFAELAESLRNEKEEWANLSDNDVLQAAKEEISLNNAIISRNIDASYDLALSMEDLSGSIAKQAITDKMKSEQENLISSKVNDPEIAEAVTKTAGEMAEKMVDANAEAMSEMVSTDKMGFWSTTGAILGGLTFDALTGGALGGIGTIGAIAGVIHNNKQADAEQEALDARLKIVNEEIVDFAIGMEEAGDDIYDQLTTYHKLTANADEWTVKAASKQYKAISYLDKAISGAENTDTNNEIYEKTARSLSNLSKAAVLTSDSLIQIIEAAADLVDVQNEQISSGVDAFEGTIKGKSNDGDKTKDVNLKDMREELGLSKSASVNEIKDAYLKKYAKYNDDGSLMYDKNGNIAMKGNNKNRTAEFNAINELVTSLGDYADLSEAQLKKVKEYSVTADLTSEIQDMLNDLNDSLGLTGKTEEELEALQNDEDFQGKASAEIVKSGLALIEELTADTKAEIEREEKEIEQKQAKLKTLDENSAAYKALNKEILDEQQTLSALTANYNNSLSALTDATYEAAGILSDSEGDETFTRINSNKKNIADLMDKVGNVEELDADDWAFLRETIIPQAIDLELIDGSQDSISSFLQDFMQGNGNMVDWLTDIYSQQTKAGAISLNRSIEGNKVLLEEEEKKLENLDESDEDYETKKKSLETNIEGYRLSIAIQEAEKEQLETVGEKYGYEEDELKLLNAQNKLQQLENASDADSLSNLKQRIEQLKILNEERKKSYETAYDKLLDSLKSTIMEDGSLFAGTTDDLKQHIKVVNGVITYDEKWYNALSNGAKQAIELWLDANEDIVTEYSESLEEMADLNTEYIEGMQETQDTLLDAYKAQLEEEQEAVQESLDKRKDLYDKYFDSLDEEDEDEDFETKQARLQNAIAKLSGATDATSLSKLKEYQEELADLESDQRQTERDRRRDAVSEMLDNQSEMLDQYYEDRLENEKVLWEHIMDLSDDAQMELLQKYTDGFENATDLTQTYMMKSFVETIRDMKAIKGESTTREDAYLKAWVLWSQDPDNYDAPHYATGGLVDYTGYAWVDGTSSRPEAFLNADQTALFAGLGNVLSNIYSRGAYNNDSDSQSSVTIENFTIAVDATLTDNNVQQTGESLADALLEGLKRTGITVNMKR